MAPKRPSPLEEPPTASSSSSEEDEPVPHMPPSPLNSDDTDSDSESDSASRWVAKPKTPAQKMTEHRPRPTPTVNNVKRPKKNGVSLENKTVAKSKSNGKAMPKNEGASTTVANSKEVDKTCGMPSLSLSEREMIKFGLSEDIVKRGLELIGASKRAELEKRWNDLQLSELELHMKCAQLIADQANLICETYNSSNH